MVNNANAFRPLRIWWAIPAAFAACFLICGYFNRPASDDLEFYRMFRESGIIGAAEHFRDTWNTRWVSIVWLNVWFGVYKQTGSLLAYHLVTLLALFAASRYFLSQLFNASGTTAAPVSLFAGCLSAALFYASFSIADTWFWTNTSTMYGWSHIYAFCAAGALLSPAFTFREGLLLTLAGAGIGGGNEPFAATTLLFCSTVLATGFLPTNPIRIHKRKLTALLLVTGIAFLYSYTGEGRVVRGSLLPALSVSGKLWVLIKSLIKLAVIYIPSKIPALLLLLAPFFYLGSVYPGHVNVNRLLKRSALLFAALCVISLLPVVWLMSEMGPERAWSQISLYLSCWAALLIFLAGYSFKLKPNAVRMLRITGWLSLLFVIASGSNASIKAGIYSRSWDHRMEFLYEQKRAGLLPGDTIRLSPLPDAGWLHSAEIAPYPEHFTNVHLRQFMGMENPVVVKIQ